jgi:hypothetical protein
MIMKKCKSCCALMVGEAASKSVHRLETLLKFQGFVPATIHDVAVSLGPMCDKCLKAWGKELSSN